MFRRAHLGVICVQSVATLAEACLFRFDAAGLHEFYGHSILAMGRQVLLTIREDAKLTTVHDGAIATPIVSSPTVVKTTTF